MVCSTTPPHVLFLVGLAAIGCGDDDRARDAGPIDAQEDAPTLDAIDAPIFDAGWDATDVTAPRPEAELWYSVDNLLVRITLSGDDGSVLNIQSSELMPRLPVGQNGLTLLDDGSLLGSRLGRDDLQSHFFHIASPPRDGSRITPTMIGVMPGGIQIEALYSDCDGRIYAMDTGADESTAEGNRLVRFTGDIVAGDFTFDVVSDLSTADVADIDDMSPGIDGNRVTDNPGLAIDTGEVYAFDYETGTGTRVAMGGSFGIHALGGNFFSDGAARLYVFSRDAELFDLDPISFELSEVLIVGPIPSDGLAGWSGLTGPLSECESGFGPI